MATTWQGPTSPSPLPTKMLSAFVSAETKVTLRQTPLPIPQHPNALLIRVVACGTNPKDWKMPAGMLKTIISSDPAGCNSGDDVAGVVAAVGPAVVDFRVGDAVAGLHELGVPDGGAFAEYAVVMDWAAFHLGREGQDDIDFDQAATIPMASFMAAIALFGMLRVSPGPWAPFEDDTKTPLVIYGASGAVGAFAVKLARLVNIHPLICVAGGGIDFVRTLLDESKGDTVVDYRLGNDHIARSIETALSGSPLLHAFDAATTGDSFVNLANVVSPGGHISLVLPGVRSEIPSSIRQSTTMAGSLWRNLKAHSQAEGETLGSLDVGRNGQEFGLMYSRLIGLWYRQGNLKPHPVKVLPSGLGSLEKALGDLKEGCASAVKYVVRVADTPELVSGTD